MDNPEVSNKIVKLNLAIQISSASPPDSKDCWKNSFKSQWKHSTSPGSLFSTSFRYLPYNLPQQIVIKISGVGLLFRNYEQFTNSNGLPKLCSLKKKPTTQTKQQSQQQKTNIPDHTYIRVDSFTQKCIDKALGSLHLGCGVQYLVYLYSPDGGIQTRTTSERHCCVCGWALQPGAEAQLTGKATAVVVAGVQREPRTCTEDYAVMVVMCHRVWSPPQGAETAPLDSGDFDPRRAPEGGCCGPGPWLQGLSGASPWGWGERWPRWWELCSGCGAKQLVKELQEEVSRQEEEKIGMDSAELRTARALCCNRGTTWDYATGAVDGNFHRSEGWKPAASSNTKRLLFNFQFCHYKACTVEKVHRKREIADKWKAKKSRPWVRKGEAGTCHWMRLKILKEKNCIWELWKEEQRGIKQGRRIPQD